MKILNLTQHPATAEQKVQGVVDLTPEDKAVLVERLTFNEIPTRAEMVARAAFIRDMAVNEEVEAVMLGGAPFFTSILEEALADAGFHVLYAFSKRESVEETQPDGSVVKKAVFKHVGFVEV